MATKRWNSNKVKMNGLGGNAASVEDIKDAGLWDTVQETPLVKGADGKTYAEIAKGCFRKNNSAETERHGNYELRHYVRYKMLEYLSPYGQSACLRA